MAKFSKRRWGLGLGDPQACFRVGLELMRDKRMLMVQRAVDYLEWALENGVEDARGPLEEARRSLNEVDISGLSEATKQALLALIQRPYAEGHGDDISKKSAIEGSVMMEKNKRACASDAWKSNPFEGIEKRLSVDVVNLRRINDEVNRKIANPDQVYAGRSSKVVSLYRKVCSDSQLCVASLGNNAKKLVGLRVKALAFDGYEMTVCSWPDALAQLMSHAAHDRAEDVNILAVGGLLAWAPTTSQNMDAVEAWKKGLVNIEFHSMEDVCARIQWLFLMLGISLADVGVCYEELDDKRYAEYRKRYFPETVTLSGNGDGLMNGGKGNGAASPGQVVQPDDQGKPMQGKKNGVKTNSPVKRSGNFHRTDNYGVSTYIVVDGVVVMHGSAGFGGDDRISRASSESEDTWKGVGYIARDGGRYGGLDGEEYSD